jgi:hypothetical protein
MCDFFWMTVTAGGRNFKSYVEVANERYLKTLWHVLCDHLDNWISTVTRLGAGLAELQGFVVLFRQSHQTGSGSNQFSYAVVKKT